MLLNPDPPRNESVTTVPSMLPIATGCQGFSHLRSHAINNYAEENEV
jgi:hypothetical protein